MGVVIVATAVVLLLWFLSTLAPSAGNSSTQPVMAHGNSGPVLSSPGGAAGANDAAVEAADGKGIQGVDFTVLLAGEIDAGHKQEEVIYVDIDGDGAEEAVVTIRGSGASRPLNWRLYGMDGGGVTLLYERIDVAQGELRIDGPRLVEGEGVYADGDQPCCPSSLKRTYYVWKGDGLVVSRVESAAPGV